MLVIFSVYSIAKREKVNVQSDGKMQWKRKEINKQTALRKIKIKRKSIERIVTAIYSLIVLFNNLFQFSWRKDKKTTKEIL